MPFLKIIYTGTQTQTNVTSVTNGTAVSLDGAQTFSAQCSVTVNTPSNQTFAAAAVNTGTEVITLAAHGFSTGLVVQISNPGTLPTGISALTNYYVIALTANTFKLADSLAHALAGTPIDISAQGSGTNTVEVTVLAGASIMMQVSDDDTNWSNLDSVSVTATGVVRLSQDFPNGQFMRLQYNIFSGQMNASSVITTKGLN